MLRPFTEADWDFSLLLASSDRCKVTVARHYEYTREALIRFDPKIKLAPNPEEAVSIQLGLNMLENGLDLGPIFTFWASCFVTCIDFPRVPFLEACAKLKAQNRTENLLSYVTDEEWIPTLLQKMERRLPSTGAGAQVRQHKTDLKYLGAVRLLKHLAGGNGIDAQGRKSSTAGKQRSRLIADAMVQSQERLGKPLLFPEQKWEQAYQRVEGILAGYDLANSSFRGILF